MKTRNLILLSSICLLSFCFNSSAVEEIEKEKVIKIVRQMLTYMHFSPKEIDDDFSHEVFDRYLEYLDPYKRNFTENEVAMLKQHRNNLDDYFEKSDMTFYNLSKNLYFESQKDNEKMVNEIFEEKLDFDKEDYLIVDEKKKSFPKNKKEKKDEWRRYIKYLILDEVQTIEEDEKNEGKSKEEVLDLAKKEVQENMDDYYRRVKSRNQDDIFSYYVNAFAEDYDPHTYYLSPKSKEYFDQGISGSFEGIGATLQDQKGYATITSLIIGGPAWKSKKVFKEDKIIEVAEEGEEAVNIVGMPLDDAIMLIRGKKGSIVTLTLKREDGSIEKVKIERDKIEIEESFVKSSILKNKQGQLAGFVSIPSFYLDYNNGKVGRNVSDDVKTELYKLKEAGVQSIILDVRNNGGGSLQEVVEIVGLFIDQGPVVQVKNSNNNAKPYYDTEEGIIWDGPLVVMTNEFSASASEILAGAIQDYKRGLIIGAEQTYGKGTVQQVIPLERLTEQSSLGNLKLTIQKFYRITGASTQIEGVKSDIVIPDKYKYAEINESFQDNALAWDELESLQYNTWSQAFDVPSLQKKSAARMQNSNYLLGVREEANYLKFIKNQERIPLQYDAFRKDLEEKENKMKKFNDLEDHVQNNFEILPYKLNKKEAQDTIAQKKIEDWHNNLKKDFYIQETLNVLQDAM